MEVLPEASPDLSERRGVFCWVMLFDGFIGGVGLYGLVLLEFLVILEITMLYDKCFILFLSVGLNSPPFGGVGGGFIPLKTLLQSHKFSAWPSLGRH